MKLLICLLLSVSCGLAFAQTRYIYVSTTGDDVHSGSLEKPVKSLRRAAEISQINKGKPVSIQLMGGTYYLPEPVTFSYEEEIPADLEITSYQNQTVFISAGRRLSLDWQYLNNGIYRSFLPEKIIFERLYVDDHLQTLARYPNVDKKSKVFNGTAEDATFYVRVLTWGNPVGGYVHALDENKEGSLHYRITGVDDTDNLELEGGWQSRQKLHMSVKDRFVENVFGELDAPGEWFLDRSLNVLYYYPRSGTDLTHAKIEVSNIKNSLILSGSAHDMLKHVSLKNLHFIHNERTFMHSKDTLQGHDRAVYRGGAVMIENTLQASIENCTFKDSGGNAIIFDKFNQEITVKGCLFSEIGATGVIVSGTCDRLEINENLFANLGIIEKQGVAVLVNAVKNINMRHNTFFGMPGPSVRIDRNTRMEVANNSVFKEYQEIELTPANISNFTLDGHQDDLINGVQKADYKLFVEKLKRED